MKVGVFINYVEGHPKGKVTIKDNQGRFLIKKCDSIAKDARVRERYFEN